MDRLFSSMELVRDFMKPEMKQLMQIMAKISDDVYAMDYKDFEDWYHDDSEDGLFTYIWEMLKDYLK